MKRFTLVALLAAAMIVCATATAFARGGWSVNLTPPDTSDEPGASGVAKVTGVQLRYVWAGYMYVGRLTVTCRGLTPGSTYSTNVGGFVADAQGTGRVEGLLWGITPNYYYLMHVVRVDRSADGSGVDIYVEVLRGFLYTAW
jgi:hypothetical protein